MSENIIKGLGLLTDISKDDILKMEQGALLHKRHSSLSFKIMELTDKSVSIRISQGKSAAENYFPVKRLIEIVHETFDRFFPGKKILVKPNPYKEPPVDKVNTEWINRQMMDLSVTLKQITEDTGLNKSYLSDLINGGKLSQSMKAFFYFYFAFKKTVNVKAK